MLEVTNILAKGRKFTRANLEGGPYTKDQLGNHLRILCAKIPGLLCRKVKGNIYLDEEIVSKPHIIIAWMKGVKIDSNKKNRPGLLASLVKIESRRQTQRR